MRRHFIALWKAIALIAVFVILITFLAGVFMPLDEEQRHLVESVDLVALAILAIDLIWHYAKSKRKKHFFKENWIMVLSFFPFAFALRFLKLLKFLGAFLTNIVSRAFHLITHSTRYVRAYRASTIWVSKLKKKFWKKVG